MNDFHAFQSTRGKGTSGGGGCSVFLWITVVIGVYLLYLIGTLIQLVFHRLWDFLSQYGLDSPLYPILILSLAVLAVCGLILILRRRRRNPPS